MWSERMVGKRSVGLALVFAAAFVVVVGLLTSSALLAGDEKAMADKAVADKAEPQEMAEDSYPLETCVVSGGKLGTMGDPVIYDYHGREIRFCCAGCVKPFESDPDKYLKKLDEAIIARDLPAYPLETCVVTGKSLTGEDVNPVNYIYKDRLVRLYDDGALKKFKEDPEKYIKKLDEAQMMHDMKMMEEMKMEKAAGMEGHEAMQMEAATQNKAHTCGGGH
jgi:YHS domain-containing protein